ncbi:MAG TPA: hypothetical protein VFB63_19465 [Bryobacteraceae bacterium]|nr:hypothetical protein [Bryobacteraceae bacterium]
MPKKYEEMRDELIAQGVAETEAKTRAAKQYNRERAPGSAPITRPARKRNFGAIVTRKRY